MSMPRVWLTDARIGGTWWGANEIEVWFHATLNMEHCSSRRLMGKVWGLDKPAVTVLQPSAEEMDCIPDSMGQVHTWIDEVDLLGLWKEEVTIYKEVMSQVDMGNLTSYAGERSLNWTLTLTVPGAAPLELDVTVAASWARAVLQFNDGECCHDLSAYDLDYPITMDRIRDKVRGTLQAYMDAL